MWKGISVMRVSFKMIAILVLQILLFSGCTQNIAEETKSDWGSFTPEDIYSYDKKYVAVQTVETEEYSRTTKVRYVRVTIMDANREKEIFSFIPARARDFWGICWESDSYNIWTQSGDVGVFCYQYEDETWVRNESAVRPEEIVSKYD